ncbi:MAG: class II glutamine amidotransferase [Chloroflexi bacterium]|nr:class II glutamine amidotransferase [Chloroflexota bacterium]
MCGIAGLVFKEPGQASPVGEVLLRMLAQLNSRGTDGTGVALYGQQPAESLVVRVRLGEDGQGAGLDRAVVERARAITPVRSITVQGDYARLVVGDRTDVARLADAVESAGPGVQVFSVGRQMEIVKQVGEARVLADRYGMAGFLGSHGIGHTRLATESRVDIAHSHPFWARPFPDIAVVHNGQITNYHKLRRKFEQRGYHFMTENDSEIIALYIAHKLAAGATLDQALTASVDDLDGTFTYLVSTPDGIGMAKDFFATKPLVVAETDELVAMASEEVALHKAFPGVQLQLTEPVARAVQVWRCPRRPVSVEALAV